MTTNGKSIFVDTNILTRATIDSAPLHAEARQVLDDLWADGHKLCISHQVIREYVANLTRPQIYSPAISMEVVLEQVADFKKSFVILPDTEEVLNRLLQLIAEVPVGGKQVHDANIVATMLANEISTLLTHNIIDFTRYNTLITILPLENPS